MAEITVWVLYDVAHYEGINTFSVHGSPSEATDAARERYEIPKEKWLVSSTTDVWFYVTDTHTYEIEPHVVEVPL